MPAKQYEVFVQKGRPWYKIVSSLVFSHTGLFVVCMVYAVGGKICTIKFFKVPQHMLGGGVFYTCDFAYESQYDFVYDVLHKVAYNLIFNQFFLK
jgi:hypothetical protein